MTMSRSHCLASARIFGNRRRPPSWLQYDESRELERLTTCLLASFSYIHLHSSEKGTSFLELSRPLARPPGAGRLAIEGFRWAWDRILRRKFLDPARARPGRWPRARTAFPGRYLVPSPSKSFNFQPPRPWRLRWRPTEPQKKEKRIRKRI